MIKKYIKRNRKSCESSIILNLAIPIALQMNLCQKLARKIYNLLF